MEGTSLKKDFFRFIIPSMLAQIIYSLYAMVDGLFVAKGVSEVALAAINISMPFMTLLFSISLLFSVGSSTIIAIYLGEKNLNRANKVFSQNLITIIAISFLITAVTLLFNKQIAEFLGATSATIEYVRTYISTVSIFAVFFIVSYLLEILIKTDGYPIKGTIIVSLGVAFNIILDYFFILRFDMGIYGAALATGISQLLVIGIYLTHFLGKNTHMKFTKFEFQGYLLFRTAKIGLSSAITEFSPGIVIFLFNHAIIKYLDVDALVSFTIISYISTIIVFAIYGISQGTQPLVSYYYGARNKEAKVKLFKYSIFTAMFISIAAFVLIRVNAEFIASAFLDAEDSELLAKTVDAMNIYFISVLILWINIIIGGYFTAIEKSKESMTISFARGLLFVFISLELFTRFMGGAGIWFVSIGSEAMCAVLSIVLFIKIARQKGIIIKK